MFQGRMCHPWQRSKSKKRNRKALDIIVEDNAPVYHRQILEPHIPSNQQQSLVSVNFKIEFPHPLDPKI